MSDPGAVLRTRGGKDKQIKATWVGEIEGGDALEPENTGLFARLFEGQSIDLEPRVFSVLSSNMSWCDWIYEEMGQKTFT